MKLFEMEGFLRGKCLPGDMKVNETNAEYLVRKFTELEQKLAESQRALRAETTAHENLQMQVEKMAAENAGLKAAFDKPQAYLSWHAIPPTWEDPLPCGEYLDVHDDDGHKNSDGTDCWPVFAKPEIKTPATDAFLAEVRAQGVEMLVKHCEQKALEKSYDFFMDAGAVAAQFAAQLRKGVQS
ncbi:hypothetical protein [Enterobacter sp. CPE_E1214]|uniref:hypothetical protein n=1 Tax=unclassified Enterobacter TaxID=2608935 RepID=UPI00388D8A00